MNYVGKPDKSLITFNTYDTVLLIVQISSTTLAIQTEQFQL